MEIDKIEKKLSDPKVWKENSVLNELNQELNQIKKTTENFEKVLTDIQVINERTNSRKKSKTLQHRKFTNDFATLSKTVASLEFQKCLVEKQINPMHS